MFPWIQIHPRANQVINIHHLQIKLETKTIKIQLRKGSMDNPSNFKQITVLFELHQCKPSLKHQVNTANRMMMQNMMPVQFKLKGNKKPVINILAA